MPFQDLPARLADVREQIGVAAARGGHGQEVTVVAVTKTYGPEAPVAAWEAGLRDVGENKVQEATAKMAQVSAPLRWHLIGHLLAELLHARRAVAADGFPEVVAPYVERREMKGLVH